MEQIFFKNPWAKAIIPLILMGVVSLSGNTLVAIPVKDNHTLIPSIGFSWSDQELPIVHKKYLSGSRKIGSHSNSEIFHTTPFSGVADYTLSGDMFLAIHLQYRYKLPITKFDLYLSSFLDWGDIWDAEEYTSITKIGTDFIENAPLGGELGLQARTPFGPVSLSLSRVLLGDFKENVENNTIFNISFGHEF